MERSETANFSDALKKVLNLDFSPVAISCLQGPLPTDQPKKVRICRAVLDAGKGKTSFVSRSNNACFGGSWHLGFTRLTDPRVTELVKKFVVEGEKLFSTREALDNLLTQMDPVPDNSQSHYVLAPLEEADFLPQIVVFIVNPEAACRLLTLAVFPDGSMPKIKIGGPTCRMAIVYPILSGETNISFYDYTARKMCQVEKDKLLVSIPYGKIPGLVENINRCSAGTAKVEFPEEFRAFLQQRLR